jgi:transcription antitermination factor NusG
MHDRAINPDETAPRASDNKHGASSAALSAGWYILRCGAGLDFYAEETLRESGWGVFLAREKKWRRSQFKRRSDRAASDFPRFPGYLFLFVRPPHWPDFRAWPLDTFYRGILGMDGTPVPLATGAIERLMAEDGCHVPHRSSVPACRALAVGDLVRVLGGAFRDFEGVIEVIDELGAHLSVPLLGRRLRLPLPLTWVEHA